MGDKSKRSGQHTLACQSHWKIETQSILTGKKVLDLSESSPEGELWLQILVGSQRHLSTLLPPTTKKITSRLQNPLCGIKNQKRLKHLQGFRKMQVVDRSGDGRQAITRKKNAGAILCLCFSGSHTKHPWCNATDEILLRNVHD
jgi:hypothetical protein